MARGRKKKSETPAVTIPARIQQIVKEVQQIASKIMEKNQIPQTTIDTLFSNEKVVSIISQILKPNSVNNENDENQQKRRSRFKR